MNSSKTVSLKNNPQYYIKFTPPTNGAPVGETIVLWIMVSKLAGITNKNGSIEGEENSKDYIALHVYPSKEAGAKVLIDKDPI